nr:RNA-directed DNA polymerase, eukaryota [Tanacetum cinerariifolium]
KVNNKEEHTDAFSDCRDNCNSNDNGAESRVSGHFKKSETPRTGGSIIGLLDEENRYDCGPSPCQFFHHWLEIDGFSKIVEDIWKDSPCVGNNAISILMGKLRILKDISDNGTKVNRRRLKGMRIPGSFTASLTKKRNIRSIRGVMVDGEWIDNPKNVKKEFFDHFSRRFCKPDKLMATLQMNFPYQITLEQRNELESEVSNEEIKKAIWECGIDKAPGPDSFTFGFFRHFWYLIDKEVNDAVSGWSMRVSGLKINMNKSKIMGTQVDQDKVGRVANKLGCLILKSPFMYLGSYVGGNMNRLKAWDEIIDRVRRRLSKWKMKMLSIGGRLTLLKSVLGSMPIFHMSLFKVPSGILRILESIRSQFFNSNEGSKKKASWVQWNRVLAPKENGGLGVSSFFALNRGLIFKWE